VHRPRRPRPQVRGRCTRSLVHHPPRRFRRSRPHCSVRSSATPAHRTVTYTLRVVSRFRQYFSETDPNAYTRMTSLTVPILSSSRPPPPSCSLRGRHSSGRKPATSTQRARCSHSSDSPRASGSRCSRHGTPPEPANYWLWCAPGGMVTERRHDTFGSVRLRNTRAVVDFAAPGSPTMASSG
jgi:hypothetical protein